MKILYFVIICLDLIYEFVDNKGYGLYRVMELNVIYLDSKVTNFYLI